MSVEEITHEAGKLPPQDRLTLLRTLQADREVEDAWLKAMIMEGVEEMERGEYTECKNEVELAGFFSRIKEEALAELDAEARTAEL